MLRWHRLAARELAIEHLRKVAGTAILQELNLNEGNILAFGREFFVEPTP